MRSHLLVPTPTIDEDPRTAAWRRWSSVTVLVGSLVFLGCGVGEPLGWLDEAATVVAVQRPWLGVLALAEGADAPLVPYYLVTKGWAGLFLWLPPLVAIRLLSVVAAALTVACVHWLVARYLGIAAGVCVAIVLLSLPGFVRFAQEARPYALLSFTVTASWLSLVAWWHPRRAEQRDRGDIARAARYGLALTAGLFASLFAVFQWPAQLVAASIFPGARWRRFGGAVAVMFAVGVVSFYQVMLAGSHGTGPRRVVDHDWLSMVDLLGRAVTSESAPSALVVVLLLALLGGLVGWRVFPDQQELVLLAWCWLIVPLAGCLTLGLWRPGLLQVRYWQPALVPLAILAGVGLITVARRAFQLAGQRRRARWVVGAIVLALLGLQVTLVAPVQAVVRGVSGHDCDQAELLATLDAVVAQNPTAPVLDSSDRIAVVLQLARPQIAEDNPMLELSQYSPSIWPMPVPRARLTEKLSQHRTLIWLVARDDLAALPRLGPPPQVRRLGFTVIEIRPAGAAFVVVLSR